MYQKPSINHHVIFIILFSGILSFSSCQSKQSSKDPETKTIRFATFNTSLFRDHERGLIQDLWDTSNLQAKHVAAIIQKINPDFLALQEFDYDAEGVGLKLFIKNYLEIGQFGFEPIFFEYYYPIVSNTGISSGVDLNNNGSSEDPNDAFGFGRFPGQYASAILSKYPFNIDSIRTFQHFLWKDMPDAKWPVDPETDQYYYSDQAMDTFRLSSKNHIDVPIQIPGGIIHAIIAHPTPPVFDGEEDRNGLRNFDEISFIVDYISGEEKARYIYDDQGLRGGLEDHASFVILGDMNADPVDGDSYNNAIKQLLKHPGINPAVGTGDMVPASNGSKENADNNPERNNQGDPNHDTSVWGLRIDYVLPSKNLIVVNSGVFWPTETDQNYFLVKDQAASDHYLVFVDIESRQDLK